MGKFFQTDRKIRMGVWGLGRGRAFLEQCKVLNIEIVAGCDYSDSMREDFQKLCPDALVTKDEDEFLACNMDAVLVATYFFAHAKDSVKALKAGKHVLSEVSAFFTPAEGAALADAVEESGKIYCLAENYTDLFVKKLWQEGTFGELAYGEIDYVHECRGLCYSTLYADPLVPGNIAHSWRSWLNFHYYCTHSLGAAMEITGTRPVRVCAPPSSKNLPGYLPGSEMGAMEPSFVTMDNGGIIRNLMGASTSDSHVRRFWGTRAFVDFSDAEPVIAVGQKGRGPKFKLTPPKDEFTAEAEKAGHSGGDFWVLYHFVDAVLNRKPLYWDIYAACDVTLTGIMAVKSQYQGGIPVDVPDFRKKEVRDQYRNDNFMQQHFDPAKIFPENQNFSETKHFSNLICDLDNAWECQGISLLISVVDGLKLAKYIKDEASRTELQTKVRQLLLVLPDLANSLKQAKYLADKYPDSLAGQALRSYYNSACPEKMENLNAFRRELLFWLRWTFLPPRPQLKMTLSADKIAAVKLLPVPEGFTLRTFKEEDSKAYAELMKSVGFDYWDDLLVNDVRKNALEGDRGIFFLVENSTGRLAATAMANDLKEEHKADGAELGWVAVSQEFRGHHFSEIVCSAAVDHYRKHGHQKIHLTTDDFRLPAIKTYLKTGWVPVIANPEIQHRWDKVYKRLA